MAQKNPRNILNLPRKNIKFLVINPQEGTSE